MPITIVHLTLITTPSRKQTGQELMEDFLINVGNLTNLRPKLRCTANVGEREKWNV